MKFFTSFFLYILLTTSVSAYITPDCSIYTDDGATVCNSYGGCYWNTDYDSCEQCGSTKYSAPGASECTSCSDFAFTEESHKIYNSDPDAGQQGQSECPWLCESGYYESNDGQSCLPCPTNNIVDPTDTDTNNLASSCTCPAGSNLIKTSTGAYYCGICGAGTLTNNNTCSCAPQATTVDGTETQNGIMIQCKCPSTSSYNAGQCTCPSGQHLLLNANNEYYCGACPGLSTYNSAQHKCDCDSQTNGAQASYDSNNILTSCECTTNATPSGSTCICDPNGDYPTSSTDDNGVVFCLACPENATKQNGVCRCDANYYGNGTTTCTRCPIGTTKAVDAAPSNISNCEMSSSTQFCDANGTNCMNLIPSGVTIAQPQ